MSNYPTIRNALQIFSIEVGLDEDVALRMLHQSLGNPEYRQRIEGELTALVTDPEAPWGDLVANDFYEIDEPEDEEEARAIVLELLWDAIFPGRPAPPLRVHVT